MQSKAKANSVVTHERLESGAIRFNVRDAGSFDFDLSKVHQSNRDYAMVHGFVQRISDGAAMSRNPETGLPATAADKMARMQALADHYMSGAEAWNRASGPRGPQAPRKIESIQKVADLRGITYAEAEALMVQKALEELQAG